MFRIIYLYHDSAYQIQSHFEPTIYGSREEAIQTAAMNIARWFEKEAEVWTAEVVSIEHKIKRESSRGREGSNG